MQDADFMPEEVKAEAEALRKRLLKKTTKD